MNTQGIRQFFSEFVSGEATSYKKQWEVNANNIATEQGTKARTRGYRPLLTLAKTINSLKGAVTMLFIAHQLPKGLSNGARVAVFSTLI